MKEENASLSKLCGLRSASVWGAVVAGLTFLFFNTATIIAPAWFLFLANAIPFLLMLALIVSAVRLQRRVERIEGNHTEQSLGGDSENRAEDDTASGDP